MRITQQSQTLAMRADLDAVSGRLARVQRQIASGRQIERVSDGPAAGLEAIRYRRSLRGFDQYARNLGDAKMWFASADSALESVDAGLTRAQDLTIQADNASIPQAARVALATEMRTIANQMVGLANTTHLGRPIFGGATGSPRAYDDAGLFLGDTEAVNRTVGTGSSYQVNTVGPDVFGVEDVGNPANGNLIQVLRDIADKIEAGSVVSAGLDSIATARSRVHSEQATLGARLVSVEKLEIRNTDSTIRLKSALSITEDVDLTDAILDLKAQEAAYTAALSVTARILDQSLLNFLR